MKKLICLTALISMNAFAGGDTGVGLYPTGGFKNSTITIISDHVVDITNTTANSQSYDYIFTLCPANEPCVDFKNHVTLNAGQHFVDKRKLQQNALYHYAGRFQATASSSAKGNGVNANHKVFGDIIIN